MTPELVALAHRAVACKGWRWMPGMMRLREAPPQMRDHLRREGRVPDGPDDWAYDDWPVIPDFTDPATLGCLLVLVREVWFAEPSIDAETLVRALETANELP